MQIVKVDRKIEFRDAASLGANVTGAFSPDKIMTEYNFTDLAMDTTNKYDNYLDTNSVVAISVQGATYTTVATDTKTCSTGFGGLSLLAARNPVIECKFKSNIITTLGMNFGFMDAGHFGSSVIPFHTSSTTTTATTIVEGAAFSFDTDQTTKYWYLCTSKASAVTGTIAASTVAPVADTYQTCRIAIDSLGNVSWFFNGVQVGYKATAITVATPFAPYICFKTRTAGVKIGTVRYCRVWQDA